MSRPRRYTLSRRALLGGAATILTLPFLESLAPRTARGQDAVAKRFLAYYIPNGLHMQDWTPTTDGAGYTVPYLLEPLAAFQNEMLVLSNLVNEKQEEGPGDHAGGTGSFLTARVVPKTQTRANGTSIDQLIASHIGQNTRLPSLEIGGEGGDAAGTCDSGYPCAFAHQVSFDADGVPIPKIANPSAVVDRLFAGYDPTESAAEAARRHARRASLLDVVSQETNSLKPTLGSQDQLKLDEYLNSVRELERRVAALSGQAQIVCEAPTNIGDGGDSQGLSDAMVDIMALAFECDITRVISYMWGNAGSNRDYAFLGADGGHHDTSHHQMSQTNYDKLKLIGYWEMQQFAKLLTRLKAAEDGVGSTVLDNTIVLLGSEISDGDRHNHDNLPTLVAGNLAGHFTSGRHITYGPDRFYGNLFVSFAQAFGLTTETFGDRGVGPLEGLIV